MPDPIEPEADRLEQEQEVVPEPAGYPDSIPADVPEADAIEQSEEVGLEDDDRR